MFVFVPTTRQLCRLHLTKEQKIAAIKGFAPIHAWWWFLIKEERFKSVLVHRAESLCVCNCCYYCVVIWLWQTVCYFYYCRLWPTCWLRFFHDTPSHHAGLQKKGRKWKVMQLHEQLTVKREKKCNLSRQLRRTNCSREEVLHFFCIKDRNIIWNKL